MLSANYKFFLVKAFLTFQNEMRINEPYLYKGYSNGFENLITMVKLLESD